MALVGPALSGARVLDLFAGTGALGLEALSRGAATCDFVEDDPSALHSLKANVALLHARPRSRIFKRDAIPFVERLRPESYDIAFADPPYGSRKLDRILASWLATPWSRLLVLEHNRAHVLPVRGASRRIEDTMVTLLRTGKTRARAEASSAPEARRPARPSVATDEKPAAQSRPAKPRPTSLTQRSRKKRDGPRGREEGAGKTRHGREGRQERSRKTRRGPERREKQ
jgi:16S rRNA (guanine966-N2)-methyltransferase